MYHLCSFVHTFCVLRNICLIQDEKKNSSIVYLLTYLFAFFIFLLLAVLGLFCSMRALCCGVQGFSSCDAGTDTGTGASRVVEHRL